MDDAHLHFVVGKGGVGKSTLAAALALEAASAGLRTLVVEFAGRGVSNLFDVQAAPTSQPVSLRSHLTLLALSGEEALAEYLHMVVPIRRLLTTVLASPLYRAFVGAAPGLRELMTVGKVWFEAERRRADGSPVWERIVVDAGASGHSLQYLQMPSAAAAAFRSGLVHREALRVRDLLADPARTRVHVVATAEEMPVTEAASIVARLRDPLGLPLGTLFVNRCRPLAPAGAKEGVRHLEGLAVDREDEATRDALLASVRSARCWEEVQEAAIARLESETGMPVLRLPLLVGEEFGLPEVERLAVLLGRRHALAGGAGMESGTGLDGGTVE